MLLAHIEYLNFSLLLLLLVKCIKSHIYISPQVFISSPAPLLPPSSGYDLMCQFKTDCLYGSDGERGYGGEIWPP